MQDLVVIIFGKPEGIIISQLIYASQYTIYLSAIAFLGGGVLGGALTFLRLIPNYFLNTLSFPLQIVVQSKRLDLDNYINKLDIEMKDLAAKLEFEEAAKIRDEINRLKAKQVGLPKKILGLKN